jgi:hypothetical protein
MPPDSSDPSGPCPRCGRVHTLDANLADWAKEIRVTGNVGAHFDAMDDVDAAEADDLARLTRQLLRYLDELPASLRRSRQG